MNMKQSGRICINLNFKQDNFSSNTYMYQEVPKEIYMSQ